MRWLFLLLLVLNAFYYVWHRQQSPVLVKEIAPLEQYLGQQKNIRLLSESPALKKPKVREVAVESVQSGCMFFGDFESLVEADVLRQRLAGLDIESTAEEVSAVSGVDYWVYLEPLASRSASLRQLNELQARQIDSFIIAEGELANGISLGIFPRAESATSVMARLTDAGYDPVLRELSREQRGFWVRVAPKSMRLLDEGLLVSLAADFGDLRHEMRPCSAIVQEQQFE